MALFALGFAENKDGGRQGLIEHCRWLRGDDPRLVHAFLVVGDYVIDRIFEGVRLQPLYNQKQLIRASQKNLIVAEVPLNVGAVISDALTYTETVGPMSILDAFRWYFKLPLDGFTCLSFLYGFLGGDATEHVEPADLIRQFINCVRGNNGVLIQTSSTLSYETLRDADLPPVTAYFLSGGFYVEETPVS